MTNVTPQRTLIDPEFIKLFLFAGKCVFTLVDTRHNIRTTYKIKKKKDLHIAWVSIQVGKEYEFAGTLFKRFSNDEFSYKHSLKSKMADNTPSVKYFKALLLNIDAIPEFIEIHHAGTCACCGRQLVVPESLHTGFGPVCLRRLMPNKEKPMKNRRKINSQLALM